VRGCDSKEKSEARGEHVAPPSRYVFVRVEKKIGRHTRFLPLGSALGQPDQTLLIITAFFSRLEFTTCQQVRYLSSVGLVGADAH